MEIIGCGRGHFYNPSEYSSCPQCARENGSAQQSFIDSPGVTEPINSPAYMRTPAVANIILTDTPTPPVADITSTEPIDAGFGDFQGTPLSTSAFQEPSANVQNYAPTAPVSPAFTPSDSHKTPFLPVVGWLVCIEGPAMGRDYRIHSQYNYIGRGQHMDICISGDSCISAEKAAILAYDDEEKLFSFGPGLGHNVVRVNGKMLMNATELNPYDELTIGKTKLLFVPLCGERFDWNGK